MSEWDNQLVATNGTGWASHDFSMEKMLEVAKKFSETPKTEDCVVCTDAVLDKIKKGIPASKIVLTCPPQIAGMRIFSRETKSECLILAAQLQGLGMKPLLVLEEGENNEGQ